MAKTHSITADLRDDAGKGASRRLRRAGLVPGVLYGAGRPARSIQLNHKELIHAASEESFFSSILELDFNGKKQKVLLRDWQMHPYRQQMLHIDVMRVREDEEIRVSVPLHFTNQEESPAGKAAAVVVSHHLTEIEVACLPNDLPEYLEMDLGDLEDGDARRLSDLVLPEGVKLVAFISDAEDNDQVVVSAHEMKAVVEEEPAEGEAAEGEAGEAEGDGDASEGADDQAESDD